MCQSFHDVSMGAQVGQVWDGRGCGLRHQQAESEFHVVRQSKQTRFGPTPCRICPDWRCCNRNTHSYVEQELTDVLCDIAPCSYDEALRRIERLFGVDFVLRVAVVLCHLVCH